MFIIDLSAIFEAKRARYREEDCETAPCMIYRWLYYAGTWIGLDYVQVYVQFENKTTRYFKSYRTLFSSVSMASLIYSQIFLEMKKINRHVRLLQRDRGLTCFTFNTANRWKNICLARFPPPENCHVYIWKSIIFEDSRM